MARSINRLKDRAIKHETKPGRHADGGNLFLVVDPPKPVQEGQSGPAPAARRWVFIYRWNGKLREMGLGSLASVSLADARAMAADHRGALARNQDPIALRNEARRQQNAGRTFGDVARELHAARKGGWKNARVIQSWLTSLETYGKSIWSKPVDTIGTEDILAILQPIWTTKAETAHKVRGRIEAVLDAARVRGLIPPDRANVARWRGHLSHLLPKRPKLTRGHHAALPYSHVPAFMRELQLREAMAARCLEFVILTGVRSGEARLAPWSEIDIDARIWCIPASRMKASREHRVPLSDRCIAILRDLEPLKTGPDSFVFPGRNPGNPGNPLSALAMEMLLRRMDVAVTVHGMRSSLRDWAGDCTSFPREVIEEALAHRVGNEVERAYRRSDAIGKRRQLLQTWADFCGGADVANNVVPAEQFAERRQKRSASE